MAHGAIAVMFGAVGMTAVLATASRAQDLPTELPSGWQTGIDIPDTANPAPGNTTVIPRPATPGKPAQSPPGNSVVPSSSSQIKLVALLTADGQSIDQGLVWRIFEAKPDADGRNKLVATHREASPALKLDPGDYIVNAAFGRAHLTRKISIAAGQKGTEQFVLNAGGLRMSAVVSGASAPQNSIAYNVYSDERDQFGKRAIVMTGAKPGLIIRLNAGIYHLVSTYGDGNASVETDVTVEAGKLTEATVTHAAAKVTFKLVAKSGGEALPDTQWSVQTSSGTVVKESVGALPTHVLAPGDYKVTATTGEQAYERLFTVRDGDTAEVEVLIQ